ncbi:hypothetical protein MMC10_009478 [Thelotrema lepadinum]|nr:hypothetical protein [Thelotrema lepadinum]
MVSALAEAFIVPPLIALAIYLIYLFVVIPIYRRRQRYSQYLPMSLYSDSEETFINRTRSRISGVLRPLTNKQWWSRRRPRTMSFDTYFGDEELEEGMGLQDPSTPRQREQDQSQRRLSRDLEAGFRDDSSSSDDSD